MGQLNLNVGGQVLALVTDDFITTDEGYQLRTTHPRVLCTQAELDAAIDRCYGENARAPYSTWFNALKAREDSNEDVDLPALAIIYHATGDSTYKTRFISRFATVLASFSGVASLTMDEVQHGLDLMWNEVTSTEIVALMDKVAAANGYFNDTSLADSQAVSPYTSVNWGYHSATGVHRALCYSGLLAYTTYELEKDPETYEFDANNYIAVAQKELSTDGNFYKIENRIAGEPTYNDALQGDYGGLYDTMPYDGYTEAYSLDVLTAFKAITGSDRTPYFLHDKYKGTLWQAMRYPYRSNAMAIWSVSTLGDFTTTGRIETLPLLARTYQDGRAQWLFDLAVEEAVYDIGLYPPYDGMYRWILFYDDGVVSDPPSTLALSTYFSGPGLVPMRSSWDEDATVGLFLAGEGISRRYGDGNSFTLGRNVDVVVHAGTRQGIAAETTSNGIHTRYTRWSISRNCMQIYDVDECYDIESDGTTGTLHSGDALAATQNFGGQIAKSETNLPNAAWDFPLGIRETSNITKYEHDTDYTYVVGDSLACYTRKIDQCEREFVFVQPDVFVVFDRVNSVNANYKKVWRIHTADEPVITGTPDYTDLGMKGYDDGGEAVITDPGGDNVTYLTTLLPASNKIVIRGGDTTLVDAQPLDDETSISGAGIAISELDVPRWLEIVVDGSDKLGTMTIHGDYRTLTGLNAFSDLVEDGTEDVAITTSNGTAAVPANTAYYWEKIDEITTSDLDLTSVTVTVPHYFDCENAAGTVYGFCPSTDKSVTTYVKVKHIGRWTYNVEAATPATFDNFLNVFCLKDPLDAQPTVTLVESTAGDDTSGALIDDYLVLFSNDGTDIETTTVTLAAGTYTVLVCNLAASTAYYWSVSGTALTIKDESPGTLVTSSSMGLATIEVETA